MPDVSAEALKIQQEAQLDLEIAQAFTVHDAETRALASKGIADLKARIKEVETRRKGATKHLDDAKKEIMGWFRPGLDAMAKALSALTTSLATYDQEQRQRQLEASKAVMLEQNPEKARALVAIATEAPAEDENLTPIVTLDFEVVDPSLVPREYCEPVSKLIRAGVKAGKEIPGVRVFEKTTYRRR